MQPENVPAGPNNAASNFAANINILPAGRAPRPIEPRNAPQANQNQQQRQIPIEEPLVQKYFGFVFEWRFLILQLIILCVLLSSELISLWDRL